jgi:hypothetical protein
MADRWPLAVPYVVTAVTLRLQSGPVSMIALGDRLLVRFAQCLRCAFMIAHWELQPS